MFQGISNFISKKVYSHALLKILHKENKNLFLFSPIANNFNMFSSITSSFNSQNKAHKGKYLLKPQQLPKEQTRTLIKFSMKDGKKISEKIVPEKFFRLDWGAWIRARAGCDKKLWKKSKRRINSLQKIVFCNKTQSLMLDKMVTKIWRKPKHYINDPYAPYLTREQHVGTKKKYWKPEGCDYE